MSFAARESAVFGHLESAFGVVPGAGGIQHLTRLMGRTRALEAMLSACDYDAESRRSATAGLIERCRPKLWVNSSDRWHIASRGFRRMHAARSRSASTRLRLQRRTIFAADSTSSAS